MSPRPASPLSAMEPTLAALLLESRIYGSLGDVDGGIRNILTLQR